MTPARMARHWFRRGALAASIGLLVAACHGQGGAKVLYVDGARGNDTTSYAENSLATPWRTIGRAAWGNTDRSRPVPQEAAKSGDVVRIAAGTYVTIGTGQRFEPAYQPANSGEAGRPIRFEGSGEVRLEYSNGRGPMIGATRRHYIEWSGFTIDEAKAPSTSDTGPVTFLGVTGGAIEHSTLTGNPSWTAREGDNYPAVRLEDASNVRVFSNVIVDFGGQTSGDGDENHAGVETYRSYPVIIENNRIVNCGAGIYMKAVNPSTLVVDTVAIRYNVFENNRSGIRVLRMPMTSKAPMLIYQNLFHAGNDYGVWWNFHDNGRTDGTYVRVFNNTFHDNKFAAFAAYNNATFKAGTHGLFRNNIVSGGEYAIRMDTRDAKTNATKDRFDFEHNVYFGQRRGFALIADRPAALADWKHVYGQDAANPEAVNADPRFVSATARDFRLDSGSPATELGRAVHGIGGADGRIVPAGAYVTGTERLGPVERPPAR